jgi:hypothetical protein
MEMGFCAEVKPDRIVPTLRMRNGECMLKSAIVSEG